MANLHLRGMLEFRNWMGMVVGAPILVLAAHAAGFSAAGSIWPAGDLNWVPGTPGLSAQTVELWGDRSKGTTGVLIKAPGGFRSGVHAYTSDYHAVVVSGTWVHAFEEGGSGQEFTPGSYWMQPARTMHEDRCKEGAECIVLIQSDEKNVLIPGKR